MVSLLYFISNSNFYVDVTLCFHYMQCLSGSHHAHFIHLNKKTILICFRLFKHYFLLIAVNQMSSSLFRLIAGATRNMFVANIFSVFSMLTLLLLSGFLISSGKYATSNLLQCSYVPSFFLFFLSTFLSTSDNLNKFWMLGYWASPLMYAQNAIATNEFTAHQWIKVLILPTDENFLILPQNKAELMKFSFAFADTSWINRVTRNNCPEISWAIF